MSDDTARELERLRAQVAELTAAQQVAAATPSEPDSAAEAEAPEEATVDASEKAVPADDTAEPATAEPAKSQLDELVGLLEAEIKDLPAITCLAVFSLGILFGRFLR